MAPASRLVSVVIITRNRPKMVRNCLEHLFQQDYKPFETIVVDSSPDEQTHAVLDGFPQVMRLRIPNGQNNMPQARNLGIAQARGEIVAFIDDDSMVQEGWLSEIVRCYSEPNVGGVGGRVLDELEALRGTKKGEIGRILEDGHIVSGFDRSGTELIEVDHVRGCNMTFSRLALQEAGPFDHRYSGRNYLEDTDMGFRVKQAGYRILYNPRAVVHHLAARWKGAIATEEDSTTMFYLGRNTTYFYVKHFGLRTRALRHLLLGNSKGLFDTFWKHPGVRRLLALCAYVVGVATGWVAGMVCRGNK